MAILINLNKVLEKRKMGLTELSDIVDIPPASLTILKNNHACAIRFSTLNAICKALECKPGDILEFVEDNTPEKSFG